MDSSEFDIESTLETRGFDIGNQGIQHWKPRDSTLKKRELTFESNYLTWKTKGLDI